MHGLIFGALQDYSAERLGARAAELWVDRVLALDQSYEDEWFVAQLERIASATGDTRTQTERGFGVFAAQTTFAGLYPDYYAQSGDVFEFLLGIEKIHELVRATVPGAAAAAPCSAARRRRRPDFVHLRPEPLPAPRGPCRRHCRRARTGG